MTANCGAGWYNRDMEDKTKRTSPEAFEKRIWSLLGTVGNQTQELKKLKDRIAAIEIREDERSDHSYFIQKIEERLTELESHEYKDEDVFPEHQPVRGQWVWAAGIIAGGIPGVLIGFLLC